MVRMDARTRDIELLLERKGLRPTAARRCILALLLGQRNHLSAEEIVEKLRGKGRRIGTATVYQNLAQMVESGLLTRFTGTDGRVRFDSNLDPHHHLICSSCGNVVDIDIDAARELADQPLIRQACPADWKINSIKLEINGLCPNCIAHKESS